MGASNSVCRIPDEEQIELSPKEVTFSQGKGKDLSRYREQLGQSREAP